MVCVCVCTRAPAPAALLSSTAVCPGRCVCVCADGWWFGGKMSRLWLDAKHSECARRRHHTHAHTHRERALLHQPHQPPPPDTTTTPIERVAQREHKATSIASEQTDSMLHDRTTRRPVRSAANALNTRSAVGPRWCWAHQKKTRTRCGGCCEPGCARGGTVIFHGNISVVFGADTTCGIDFIFRYARV